MSNANAAPTAALCALLMQTRTLVEGLSGEQYTKPGNERGTGSIGGHVRHVLDHIRALVRAVSEQDELDYDARERGTRVEHETGVAVNEIQQLICDLEQAALEQRASESVRVRTLVQPDAEPLRSASTVGRELAFVVSHTVHHQAMIAELIKRIGVTLPTDFGYAPGTVRHLNRTQCARSAS